MATALETVDDVPAIEAERVATTARILADARVETAADTPTVAPAPTRPTVGGASPTAVVPPSPTIAGRPATPPPDASGTGTTPTTATRGRRERTRRPAGRVERPRPPMARGLTRVAALLLGAGVLTGAAMSANALAPGRLTAPEQLAALTGQSTASEPATTVTRRSAPTAVATTPATAPASATPTVPTTSAPASTTAAPTTSGAPATSTASTVAASTLPPPVGSPAPPHSTPAAVDGPGALLEGAPQTTLPGGQPWPVATRADDSSLVVSGVVPSQEAADRLITSLDWYAGLRVNQLTIDPAAVGVRYVPVRLTASPLVLVLGQRDLTEDERHLLPLWAKFLVEHPSAHVMIVITLPASAGNDETAAAIDHLTAVQGELLATGASATQVTNRTVSAAGSTGADPSTVTVDVAVAMDDAR